MLQSSGVKTARVGGAGHVVSRGAAHPEEDERIV